MNMTERVRMVKAMEYIVRNVNNEDLLEPWLAVGVADGDIPYGDLSDDIGETEYWTEDENFSELMGLFLKIMFGAKKDGGLYCDNILSE